MQIWRMAFRVGSEGRELWPQCKALGIAAITYEPLAETDLSRYGYREPKELWNKLESAQKFSLSAVAYEMAAGDVIYVKQGPLIVGRGVVQGGYRFDWPPRIVDQHEVPWPHCVPVAWEPYFVNIRLSLGAEQSTVKKLTESDKAKLYGALRRNPDADVAT